MDSNDIKVLLIEDNAGDARLIEEILAKAEGHPYSVTWAQSLTAGVVQLIQVPSLSRRDTLQW